VEVLITGGAGEIGKYLTKGFFKRGHEVVVLDQAPKTQEMDPAVFPPGCDASIFFA